MLLEAKPLLQAFQLEGFTKVAPASQAQQPLSGDLLWSSSSLPLTQRVSAKGHGMWMLGIGQGGEEEYSTIQGCRGLCSMTRVGVVREGNICGEA